MLSENRPNAIVNGGRVIKEGKSSLLFLSPGKMRSPSPGKMRSPSPGKMRGKEENPGKKQQLSNGAAANPGIKNVLELRSKYEAPTVDEVPTC